MLASCLCFVLVSQLAQDPPPTAGPAAAELAAWAKDRDERMRWWREARFGLFVHFGLYSAAGGMWNGKVYPQHYAEWIQHWAAVPCAEYAAKLKPLFQPEPGFAEAWADLAKAAGMRYAVMTAKHHDGFTLFRSREPWSIDNPLTGGTMISPPDRDVAREFADAMRARGLRPGFYYSLLDWQHPHAYEMALPAYPKDGHLREPARYLAYVRGHVGELLDGYGPLATLWFDYSDRVHQGEAWGAAQLLADLRRKQPSILVNNRLFEGLENRNGDYGTPEKYVPPTGIPGMDWEVNHTLNESYGFSSHDQSWKDTATVVRLLCDVVSKGGNLLLNVGPDRQGRVPEPARRILRGVGAWLQVHGEAIYGTTASPFARLSWGRATRRQGQLYLLVFEWPASGELHVPLRNRITAATLLDRAALPVVAGRDASGGLVLTLPKQAPDAACSVVRLALDGAPDVLSLAVRPDATGSVTLLPHDATLTGPSLRVEQVGAVGDVKYNLGYWLDRAAFASWPVSGLRPGAYRVVAELACKTESAGALVTLAAGAQHLDLTVPGTGGWQDYRQVELGELTLASGPQTLELRAKSKPGEAVLNLRSLRLVPR